MSPRFPAMCGMPLCAAFCASVSTLVSVGRAEALQPPAPAPVVRTPLNNLQDMFTHGDGFLMCAMGGVVNTPKGCEPTNSTTQAKFLGKGFVSAEQCSAACVRFTYRGVFPCRSWTFFHANYGNSTEARRWAGLCYARIDDVWAGGNGTRPADGAVTSGLRRDVPDCYSAMQCELNGRCVHGKCACAQGWKGRFCQTLDLAPARRGNGYHRENTTSWGGSIIPPEVSGLKRYQLIVSEFDLHCGFNAWYEVSRIVRASSTTADGPYTFEEVVKPRFAHGVAVARSPTDNKFLLYHIGDGDQPPVAPGLMQCTNGTTPVGVMPRPSYTNCGKPKQVKARLMFADSVLGPWVNDTVLGCGDENPSPHVFADGSAMYLNRFGSLASTNNCTSCPGRFGPIYRAAASHYTGPYVFDANPLFPGCSDPCVEDSNVYTVPQPPNASGRYANANVGTLHALFHGRTHEIKAGGVQPGWIGRHAWSNDSRGEQWFMSPYGAFSEFVQWEDGGNTTFSTRERPHVLIENGLITHLLSGVQTGPANCLDCSEVGRNRDDDYAYTFVQPIQTNP